MDTSVIIMTVVLLAIAVVPFLILSFRKDKHGNDNQEQQTKK